MRGSILYINGTELGIWILETFSSGTSSKYATRDLFKEIVRVRHRLRKELCSMQPNLKKSIILGLMSFNNFKFT